MLHATYSNILSLWTQISSWQLWRLKFVQRSQICRVCSDEKTMPPACLCFLHSPQPVVGREGSLHSNKVQLLLSKTSNRKRYSDYTHDQLQINTEAQYSETCELHFLKISSSRQLIRILDWMICLNFCTIWHFYVFLWNSKQNKLSNFIAIVMSVSNKIDSDINAVLGFSITGSFWL